MLSEAEKVRQLKGKDATAFAWLYDGYAPALYGMILKLQPENDIAAVILEESFLKFWLQIETFDPAKEKLILWMVRITVKHCREVLHVPKELILQNLNTRASFRVTA